MIYYDNNNETNTTLIIDKSKCIANRNFLPYNQFRILNDAINTGFYRTSIPLQGAASGVARPKLMVGPDHRGTKEVLEDLALAAPG